MTDAVQTPQCYICMVGAWYAVDQVVPCQAHVPAKHLIHGNEGSVLGIGHSWHCHVDVVDVRDRKESQEPAGSPVWVITFGSKCGNRSSTANSSCVSTTKSCVSSGRDSATAAEQLFRRCSAAPATAAQHCTSCSPASCSAIVSLLGAGAESL